MNKLDLDPLPRRFPCLYCHRRFETLLAADQHMMMKHGADYGPSDDELDDERTTKALRRYDQGRTDCHE